MEAASNTMIHKAIMLFTKRLCSDTVLDKCGMVPKNYLFITLMIAELGK